MIGNKYAYQEILRESSKMIVTMLDKDEMLNYLVHSIQHCFKIHKACLLLKSIDGSYVLKNSWGMNPGLVSGFSLKKNSKYLCLKKALITYMND